jgi:glycosyltransferase involved in cell wall biosynthesis
VNVLFLTTNPNLCSTARILQCWLTLGPAAGVHGRVVAQRPGPLANWLAANHYPYCLDPMPWPNRRWPFPSLWHAWKVARWARRHGVDVIHCNEHDIYPFALLLRRFLPRPLVCHVRYKVEAPYAQWLFGRGRQPDALLWTSRQQWDDCAEGLVGLVPKEAQHVLYLGLDLNTFGTLAAGRAETRKLWGFSPEEVVVGTASALRPRKRIEDFIDLVAQLARTNPRVVGAIAGDAVQGDESYRAQILRQIEETGLGRRLRWLGDLEPVEPFYHAVDVFVSTSEYETFGNSVCEAMACRRPVVAYRGGSVREVVGDAGLVVETGDFAGLQADVATLVGDPQQREELGKRGRERVAERFNPARSLDRLRNIYRSLTGGAVGCRHEPKGNAAVEVDVESCGMSSRLSSTEVQP